MSKQLNLIGQQFGNLLVIAQAKTRKGRTYWLCRCLNSGEEREVRGTNLTSGNSKNIVLKADPLLNQFKIVWQDMNRRCYSSKHDSYKFYGGSINPTTVCDEWHKDNPNGFNNFKADMWEDYKIAKAIHGKVHLDKDIKISGNRIYCKEACQWIKPLTNIKARYSSTYKGIVTKDKVRYIREERSKGRTYDSIAKELNISKGCAYAIAIRKTWKDVA